MTIRVQVERTVGTFRLAANFASSGKVTAFFGRSGSGKTTLVNLIAGLLTPEQGRIAVDDFVLFDSERMIDLPPHRRRIGYVFQEGRLFPHLSVRSNLLYGRRLIPATERWGTLEGIVDLLGIGALLDRRPADLSGGEKQRVAIGRALLASPKLLLMDEPLASLDESRKGDILPYVERLRDEMKLPIIYVSHALEEVARLADTLVLLDGGQTVAAGPIADILSRLDLAPLTGLADASAVIHAKVVAHDLVAGLTTLDHPAGRLTVPFLGQEVGTEARLRVRARDVALAVGEPGLLSIRNRLKATVTEMAAGAPPTVDLRLAVANEFLIARVTAEAVAALGLERGSPVTALVKAASFDRRTVGSDEAA
jgi:molybdate transport system ATP-binding protein